MNIPLKKYGDLLANYLKPQKSRVTWLGITLQLLSPQILVLGVLVALCFEHWLAGFSMALYALTVLATLIWVSAYVVPYWANLRQVQAEFFGFLGEHLGGTEDLRANGAIAQI